MSSRPQPNSIWWECSELADPACNMANNPHHIMHREWHDGQVYFFGTVKDHSEAVEVATLFQAYLDEFGDEETLHIGPHDPTVGKVEILASIQLDIDELRKEVSEEDPYDKTVNRISLGYG